MDNRGQVFRALVVDSDPTNGNISVTIPALGGTLHPIPISTIGRQGIDGTWKVPASGTVVLVAADDSNASTLFLIPTYTHDTEVWATDIYGDFSGPTVIVARNDGATTISANSVVTGRADGAEMVVVKANANDAAKPAIGFAVNDIAPNAYGKVAVSGLLAPFNTSTLSANSNIFSGTTGNVVATPVGLSFPQIVGRVLEVSTTGSILIDIENTATEELGSFSGTFLGTVYATAGNLGGSASGWIIDSDRIESRGATQKIVLDGTDGEIYIGTYGVGAYNNASTPFYVNEDGYFSLGQKLTFNPTTSTLDINGTVTADAGQIGGWTVSSNKLSSGTGASSVALASSGGTAIWAGASSPAGATFKVTDSGYLTASGVDLSGRLVATSGSIGNWLIDGGTLKSTTGSAGTPIVLDSTTGKVYVGNENWANTNNRFYVDNLGKFSLGSKLTWDTTNLIVDGTITAASGTIGGWSIDNTKLYAGTGSNYVALSADNTVEYRTWAGHPTPASAPYYITKTGGLYASNASIQGRIVATSGSFTGAITGASVSGSSITGGSISGGYITGGSISGGYITGGSVSGGYITGGSVSGGYITGGSISGTSVSGSTVTGGSISGGYITGGSVSGGYITGGSINGSSVTGASLSGGQITIGSGFAVNSAGAMTSTSGSIGGFTIGANSLTAGTGASSVGLNTTGYPFYAGSTTASAAPFRVSSTGALTATSASITGSINATSGSFTGSISGASVSGSSITGGSISGGYITGGSINGGYITGGSVSGGYITGGSINGSSVTGASLSGGQITIGSGFSVNSAGAMTSTSGSIGGWKVNSTTIYNDPSGYYSLSLPGTSGNYASTPDAADLDILGTEGTKFLSLPGVIGNYASTAFDASFNLAGVDAEWIVCVNVKGFSAVDTVLLSNPYGSGWFIFANGNGRFGIGFNLAASPGSVQYSYSNSGLFSLNTTTWIRVTRNTTTGEVLLYKSESSPTVVPTSWTSVASIQPTPPAGDLVSNTSALFIGNYTNVDFYRAIIKSNGTTIYDADFTAQAIGTTSFTEATGKTVTVTGSGSKIVDGTTFLNLPGITGNYASTPDSSSLDILGTQGTRFLSRTSRVDGTNFATVPSAIGSSLDITGDISVAVQLERESPTDDRMLVLRRKNGVDSSLVAYGLGQWVASGQPSLKWIWTDAAGVTNVKYGTVAVPTSYTHVGATHDVDNGAGQNVIRFYGSTDGTSWTLLETITSAGVTNIRSNSTQLGIGGNEASVYGALGKYYRARIWNTASSASPFSGTPVLDANFSGQTIGATSFVCTSGQTVTLNGTAVQIIDGTTYGFMSGVSGSAFSTPDSASLDVSDMTLTARVALNVWNGASTNQTLIAKYDNGTTQYNFIWFISTTGRMTVNYAVGGVLQSGQDWGVNPATYPFTNGQTYWLRARRIAATGVWRFDYAPDSETEPSESSASWVNVGGDRSGTAGTIDGTTASLTVGAFNNTLTGYVSSGRFYRAIVRNANTAGTVVFDANFNQIQFSSTFREGSSNAALVTVNGTGARIERSRDLDIITKVALSSYNPAANNCLVSKFFSTGSFSYELNLLTGGFPQLRWSYDGTNILSKQTSAISPPNGSDYWLRATLDVDNGSGGNNVNFYTSSDGVTWSGIGSTITTAGITSIAPTTANLSLGSRTDTGSPSSGKMYRAIVRNGINGSPVFDADFTKQFQFATTFPDRASLATVTVNGTGARIERNRDIELVCRASLTDWSPASANAFIGKWRTTGNQRSYTLYQLGTTLTLLVSSDGLNNGATEQAGANFSAAVDGTTYWLKVTKNTLSGLCSFYYAADQETEPTSWTFISSSTMAYSGPPFPSSSPVEIGSGVDGTAFNMNGKVYQTIIRNGIGGTTVFNADFTNPTPGTTSFVESTGKTVTITGASAAFVGTSPVTLSTTGGYPIYIGSTAASSAPFRVTDAGGLIATSASITGNINATSGTFTGSITGASVSGSSITGGSISGGYITGGSVSGGYVTGGSVSGTSISGSTITGGSISGNYITGGSVSGGYITGGSINGSSITGGSVSGGYITGGSVSGGYITGGSINGSSITIGSNFSVNTAGSLTASNASISGNIVATSGSFTGSLTSTSGSIGGFAIGANTLTAGTGSSAVGISSDSTYPFWAGKTDRSTAPFSVRYDGYVTASSVSVLNFYNTGSSPAVINGQFTVDSNKVQLGRQIGTGASNTGIYINKTVGTTNEAAWDNYIYANGTARIGNATNSLVFDGTDLTVTGKINAASINAQVGNVGGFTLGTTSLTAGTGASSVGLNTTGYPFYAGSATANAAPFRVTSTGALTATSASITGYVNATSGSFTGSISAASVSGSTITGGTISGTSITGGSVSGGYINGGSINGTALTSTTITGGSISGNYITGGSVSGGYITGGSINGTSVTGASLSGGQISIGSNFSVNSTGTLTASGASIAGTINAASINAQAGNVGGFTLGATSLTAGSGASAVGLNTTGYPFYAGSTTASAANFRVTNTGNLVATSASLTGYVNATSGSFSGTVNAASINAQVGNVGGFTLGATSLTAGTAASSVGLNTTGYPFYAGSSSPATAPFRVTSTGSLVSTSGSIGGWTINPTNIYTEPPGFNAMNLPGVVGNYASTPDTAALDVLGIEGTKFLALYGRTGECATTANTAALNITGAIELVGRCIRSYDLVSNYLLIKGNSYATRSYSVVNNVAGGLSVYCRDSALTTRDYASTVVVPYTAGTAFWWKATIDPVAGQVKFYTAADSSTEPTSWAQLGTTVSATFTGSAMTTNTEPLNVGLNFGGNIYRTIIRNGIGGASVFDSDFTAQSIGATSFTESTGKTVTLVGSTAKIVDGTTFLALPGTTGNYASTPDSAALDITGDIEIVVRVGMSDWTQTGNACLIGKMNSYTLNVNATGYPYFQWYGTAGGAPTATEPLPFTNGQSGWLKVTWDANNGASGNTTRFFWDYDYGQAEESVSWVELGTPVVTAGVGTIAVTTSALEVGSTNTGATRVTQGKIYRAIVRNGIGGTTVFDAAFNKQFQFSSTFVEGSSNGATVTVNGTGARIERNRDVELITRVLMDDWTPASEQSFISKYSTGSNSRSYALSVTSLGKLAFRNSFDGVNPITRETTVVAPLSSGTTYWIKVAFDVDNGAGGNTATFYYAIGQVLEPQSASWIPIGDPVTVAGLSSIYPGSGVLEVGSLDAGTQYPLSGKVSRSIVRNGLGGAKVFDADFSGLSTGVSSFVESTGKTVTFTGSSITFVPISAIGIATTGGYPIYVGSTSGSAAPFSISDAGVLRATGAQLTGDINATSFQYTTGGSAAVYMGPFATPTLDVGFGGTGVVDRGIQIFPNASGWNAAGLAVSTDLYDPDRRETILYGPTPTTASISSPYLSMLYDAPGALGGAFSWTALSSGKTTSPYSTYGDAQPSIELITYPEMDISIPFRSPEMQSSEVRLIATRTYGGASSSGIPAQGTARISVTSPQGDEGMAAVTLTAERTYDPYGAGTYSSWYMSLQGPSERTGSNGGLFVTGPTNYLNVLGTVVQTKRLELENTGLVLGTTQPSLMIGPVSSGNMAFDSNEIQTRNNGVAANLFLNFRGGDVFIGASNGLGGGNTTISSAGDVYDSTGANPRYYVRSNTGHTSAQYIERGNLTTTTNASGDISVTFTEAFSIAPTVIATPYDTGGTDRTIVVTARSTTGFTVRSRTAGVADASVTRGFHWIAMGPR